MNNREQICPFSPDELLRYEKEVRRRILEKDGGTFLNKSAWHASIILREFLRSAQDNVRILCGKLNEAVYGTLWPEFESAIERGVRVQVLTESRDVSATALAESLRARGAFRSLSGPCGIFHFAIVDGMRYRAEREEVDKSALVCACASNSKELWRVHMMGEIFDDLWSKAQ